MNSIEARPIWQSKAIIISKIFGGFMMISLILFGLSASSNNFQENLQVNFKSTSTSQRKIQIEVYNNYNLLYGQPGKQYPWLKFPVVEPYQTTTLEAVISPTDSSEESTTYTYVWTIEQDPIKLEGQKVQYTFKNIVYHNITLEQVDSATGEVLQTSTLTVVCRYVRREMRDLSEEDLESYFSALEVVYNTPNIEGKELYGDHFNDITTFVSIHNKRAGDIVCDHMHDGYGFMTSHVALTFAFERALQSVNPKVTVPYWDYTIDTVDMLESGSIESFQNSIVFNDDWFGEIAPESKIVTRGRFAYTPVKSHMFNVTTTEHNSYGLLRAPWNQNKIPYVTRNNGMCGFRINQLASCASHYDLFQLGSFDLFTRTSQYVPHGSIHIAIGGMWGSDWSTYLESKGFNLSSSHDWNNFIFTKYKNLYRSRVLECPTYCSGDTSTNDCKCTCPRYEDFKNDKTKLSELIETFVSVGIDESFHTDFLDLLCNKMDGYAAILGDQLESASPADVAFWPIHPTMDRLFQWKRLTGFESMDWHDNAAWSSWYNLAPSSTYCDGHNLDDTVGFADLFDSYLGGVYTNADLLHFTNPEKDFSPYIYDKFEWDHCTQFGYPLTLLEQ